MSDCTDKIFPKIKLNKDKTLTSIVKLLSSILFKTYNEHYSNSMFYH